MALDMKTFNAVLGKHGNTKNSMMRDSDGDGVINVLDCKPLNPRKQGLSHRIAANVAERFGRKERAKELRERGKILDEARREARIEGTRTRAEEIKKTAIFKAEQRGKRARERIKTGGTVGQIGRGIGSFARNIQASPISTTRSTTKRKGKKGKRSKRKSGGSNSGGSEFKFNMNDVPKFI